MRILGPVVAPSAGAMLMRDPKVTRCGVVGSQIVRDQIHWQRDIFPQELAHQFQRSGLIPFGLDEDIENLSFTIDGAPTSQQNAFRMKISVGT